MKVKYSTIRTWMVIFLCLDILILAAVYVTSCNLWSLSLAQSSLNEDLQSRSIPETSIMNNIKHPQRYADQVKKIMDYTGRAHDPNITVKFNFQKCKFSACIMTSLPAEVDVLIFSGGALADVKVPSKPIGQIWLMSSKEPPNYKSFRRLQHPEFLNKFNWTRTILEDSDFVAQYGSLVERPEPRKDYEAIYESKKYDVAWFVSHCHTQSQREVYVRRMTSRVDVHIFGLCGNMSCGPRVRGHGKDGKIDPCLQMLPKYYKFYLSFENSLCRNYVTEKFFNLFPDVDVIPVVRGGADYRKLFPTGIFVNSDDFQSPESLGEYLHALSGNKTAYIEMLKKKNRFTVGSEPSDFQCDLCRAVHLRQPTNVYRNLYSWLNSPGNCFEPNGL